MSYENRKEQWRRIVKDKGKFEAGTDLDESWGSFLRAVLPAPLIPWSQLEEWYRYLLAGEEVLHGR